MKDISEAKESFFMDLFERLKCVDVEIGGQKIEVPDRIIAKTIEIFKDRILVFFQEEDLPEEAIRNLFRIQLIVFMVDIYYESHWDFEASQISPLWDKISDLMIKLGLSGPETNLFLEEIRAYEKIEQDMRKGKTVDSFKIEEFYYFKSCDVRLQRNLARFVQNGAVCNSTAEEIDFDILGEILDDLDDLVEDEAEGVYNGNRFLCSLRKEGSKAIEEYRAYLSSLTADSKSIRIQAMAAEISGKLEKFVIDLPLSSKN